MSDDVVIVSATRTAVGAFNGAFANTPAHELGAHAIKSALERAGIESKRVSEVIIGQILTAGKVSEREHRLQRDHASRFKKMDLSSLPDPNQNLMSEEELYEFLKRQMDNE